ncbi:unnamed protein product [Gongylonema pulchrum]|uniref:MAGE domain-containing protein n=1 Tax=Gongylonema pulchrum TaxID=637853 RepID=A0A183D4W1_9BILA|nr:unnamed protein product [Gongylonema pulchrum]
MEEVESSSEEFPAKKAMVVDEVEQLDKGRAELAQYILYTQCRGKGCIKEAEVRQVLSKIRAGMKRSRCIDRTVEYLEGFFGIKVSKVETLQGFRLYIGNALETNNDEAYSDIKNRRSDEEKAKYGVLIAVLMFIYMVRRPGAQTYAVPEKLFRVRP